ncbi:MAG TPA: hypothetical protein VK534_01250 [Methylomirabilota bacterium]|nr:hypothetical protein [Methylomirabilota bacterium]
MANKTKSKTDTLNDVATTLGVLLMTAATTLGMIDLPEQPDKRVVLPNQPAFAVAAAPTNGEAGNSLRRERDEVHPQHISYGVNQRTPSRTGRA